MKKIALTALAVMAVVGVFAIQPVDAKKVEQDPVMTPIEMPMNDEIQQVNGVSKSTNQETRRLSNRGQVYNGQVVRNTGLSKGKYMAGSLRQTEALQELVNHLQQNGQEVPSSIDIIITQEGYRIKTIFNYNENISNLPAYQQQYEQENFPTMK